MPITGSQKALMQARSGIERAGASRTGYYTPYMAVTIGGANRRTSIMFETLRVSTALNDEPDSASFTMKPGSTVPALFTPVVIGLGLISNRLFAGSVVTVAPRRVKVADSPFYDVQCVDWLRLFDRLRVSKIYRSALDGFTLDQIVSNVVAAHTSGFTSVHVQASAIVPDVFTVADETPSQILTRLVHLNGGGGWYIDADRDVHWFGPSGETGTTPPVTITDTLGTVLLNEFRHATDGRELRNRVIVKGRSTRLRSLLINDPTALAAYGIPVEESWMFDPNGGVVNIGQQIFDYQNTSPSTDDLTIVATVSSPVASGATSIALTSATALRALLGSGAPCWFHDDAGNYFNGQVNASTDVIDTIPSGGLGMILVAMATGAAIYPGRFLRYMNSHDGVGHGYDDIQDGEAVRVRIVEEDTAAQTALAAIEGGDGIHEHVIEANDADYLEADAIAQADLDLFADETGLPASTWATFDMNATVGAMQPFNLAGTDPFVDTLTITNVEHSWPRPDSPPLRRCTASTVKLESFAALLGGD